jgi:serine/threonine protein kinase
LPGFDDIRDSLPTQSGDGATVGDGVSLSTSDGEASDRTYCAVPEETHSGDAPSGPIRLEPGTRIGAYQLERRIGSGGMGEVHAARHIDSGKPLAIKFMSRTTPRLLYRFKREFRALAGVSHRNVITLGELVVPANGPAFFTMEFVDGVSFVDYVRRRMAPGELPNLVRLGRALRQLLRGLAYLHDFGCVHRDVKPSNVMVTHDGRVVILDFGLVSELGNDDEGISRDGQLLGTPAYMAPEQAAMHEVTPATDFYAVGVMLFECLTGVLPFRGSALEIVLRKQDEDPPDPCDFASGIPPSLRELCMRLLAPDPDQRPKLDELLEALTTRALGAGDDDQSQPSSSTARSRRARVPFIGRHAELRQLSEALGDVRSSQTAVTTYIGGASGLGKSALIDRFLSEVRATTDAMILRGRCLERESVPYKGIDSVVDSLSSRLRRMLEDDRAALQPRHVAPLLQIFPVLSDVWPQERSEPTKYEPSELRRLGTAALREVLANIARQRPLVIHIDDFQWSDVDGARLLTALVRPPEPPVLLLLISFRGALAEAVEVSEAMRESSSPEARLGRDIREIELGPLPDAAATELAAAMLGFDDEGTIGQREDLRGRAELLARRASGNPFYIGQMLLDANATMPGDPVDDRIVARRIVQLPPPARRVLASLAVSGGPTPMTLIRELGPQRSTEELAALPEIIDELCKLGLVVRRGTHLDSDSVPGSSSASASASISASGSSSASGSRSIDPDRGFAGAMFEVAHARIREVTIGELETGELTEIHLEFGRALERLGGDMDALAEHFELAGERSRALDYAEQAAEQAIAALAFGRAVARYRRALVLLDELEAGGQPPDPARRRRLRLALANQLINFGRSSEAGRLLRELALEAESPVQALRLCREAAAQLLEAGHVGEGLALSAAVLREVGEAPPRGFWASLWGFLFGRLRLRLRGLGYQEKRESELPPERLELFDTLWLINRSLTLHLEMHSFVLHNRLVRLALELGEPKRLAMMLANEMLVVASGEGEARVHAIAGEARELASHAGNVEVDRFIDLQSNLVDYALNRFKVATDQLRDLLVRLEDVAGGDWMRLTGVLVYSSLCVITGRWSELYRNLPQWLAAARERGNLREIVELEAYAAMTELHRGNIAQARYHLENGRSLWDASSYNYTSVMLDRVEIFMLLGEGQLDRVVARVDELLAAVKRSSVAFNPIVQRFVDQLIGRCWAAVVVHSPTDDKLSLRFATAQSPSPPVAKLHARLRKVCRRLRASKISLYVGEAALFEAALASVGADEAQLRRRWREAERLFDQAGIESQLAAVRWQLARITGDAEARNFSRAASKYFAAHGIADPAVVARMLAPSVR